VQISAGRDLIDFEYSGQNIAATDATVITAGRDITVTDTSAGQDAAIQAGGPGSLDIFAGRNVNLGLGGGITTVGDLLNPNLQSASGTDLTLAVGYGNQGANDTSFLKAVIEPTAATAHQTELVNYVESQTDTTGLSFVQAEPIFSKFPAVQQAPLIDDVFFNELLLSGRAANSGTGVGFSEGYAAIDALYPGSRNATTANPNPYAGNLRSHRQPIYTESGGNISILVPGGSIDVGLATTPVGVTTKSPRPAWESWRRAPATSTSIRRATSTSMRRAFSPWAAATF
jgi:filamentous hemagglutinin